MGSLTENYNLYKPDNNETGWGDEVNNNFDIIDSELKEINDELGKKLEAVDNRVMFQNNEAIICPYKLTAGTLSTMSILYNRLYLIPFSFGAKTKIKKVGIYFNDNPIYDFTFRIGIYGSDTNNLPYGQSLLASVTRTFKNIKDFILEDLNYTIEAGKIYYVGLICSCSTSYSISSIVNNKMYDFLGVLASGSNLGYTVAYFEITNQQTLPSTLPSQISLRATNSDTLSVPAVFMSLERG